MLVVDKTVWDDGEVNYDISVQDSRYDHNYTTLFGRLKTAMKILFEKPNAMWRFFQADFVLYRFAISGMAHLHRFIAISNRAYFATFSPLATLSGKPIYANRCQQNCQQNIDFVDSKQKISGASAHEKGQNTFASVPSNTDNKMEIW
jgi:hypothetical protein